MLAVSDLYVSGSITSVGEERAFFSAFTYLCGLCIEGSPLPLGAWVGCVILL